VATILGKLSQDSVGQKQIFQRAFTNAPDNWIVFFKTFWTSRYGQSDSDVIVLDPARGLFYLEVKDGAMTFKDGVWWQQSYDPKSGKLLPARKTDPEQQATKSQANLNQFLERSTGLKISKQWVQKNRRLPSYWGLWFTSSRTKYRPEMDKWTGAGNAPMIFQDQLSAEIEKFPVLNCPLTDSEIQRIVSAFAPEIHIPVLAPSLLVHSGIDEYSAERTKNSANQIDLYLATTSQASAIEKVDELKEGLVGVLGCPGSGKTLLAALLASKYSAQGKKVLVTTRKNENLRHLETLVRAYPQTISKNVFFASSFYLFEKWKALLADDGANLDQTLKDQDRLERDTAFVLRERSADVVIVDEAQADLVLQKFEQWQFFGKLLIMCADDAQDDYFRRRQKFGEMYPEIDLSTNSHWDQPLRVEATVNHLGGQVFHLGENMRSTNSIWTLASRPVGVTNPNFQTKGLIPELHFVPTKSESHIADFVASRLRKMRERGISDDSMMVVIAKDCHPWEYDFDEFGVLLLKHGFNSFENFDSPGIFLGSPSSVRGFERTSTIVVLESDNLVSDYLISASRAVAELEVVCTTKDTFELLSTWRNAYLANESEL